MKREVNRWGKGTFFYNKSGNQRNENMSNNEEQRALYEMRAKILKDKVSALNKARREGIEEGIKEGKKAGIKEGIHGVALNMKRAGIDFQVIQQMTGLQVEVIERLK